MTRIQLREWRRRDVRLPRVIVDRLVGSHAEHIGVSPTADPDTWTLRPTSFVGTIRCDDHVFLIQPKASLPNLLAMMGVPISSEVILPDLVELKQQDDLLVVMARLLCVAVESTTRQGIRRDYVVREDRLLSPRGRIDVPALARMPGTVMPVPCRFDDHTADIPINRLLKAAMSRVVRLPDLPPSWRRRLLLQLHEFEDVGPPGPLEWARSWTPSRMERHYRTAVHLSRVILEGGAIADQFGPTQSTSFLLNMNQLFEHYVTRQIQLALPDHTVTAQDHVTLGRDGSVTMRPDIVISRGGRTVGVADCKYKLLDDDFGRSHDYYQALAYAMAYGLDEAWLIYARDDGQTSLSDVPVRHSPVWLRTVGIDLSDHVGLVNRRVYNAATAISWPGSDDQLAPNSCSRTFNVGS